MKHVFVKGSNPAAPAFVMFHGTGGNEHDLLPIAEMISPGSSVLGLRGNVLENGMPRFFRRLAEGVFDEQDLIARTDEVMAYLDEAAKEYEFDRSNLVAVGYSNGANIIASLLFQYASAVKGAILFHPMVPRRGIELPASPGLPVFIGAGTNDPLVRTAETEELTGLLEGTGADVTVHWGNQGHQLSRAEVEAAQAWYNEQFVK
ncbi:alpha/beta hydrolase [Paenibacillus physcomitrellae]|uniref:Carboxylesterase n=1 Tax=Paenibacillus physcomitrellae TaxID=1619311 RepID=A0ABQ1GM15_9BACL|nr:alpha/beta hydrolase [Paenibacillus physcomitrellae]GGA46483.1 carboxylesterase [Paenibacillus physcomitrellae]